MRIDSFETATRMLDDKERRIIPPLPIQWLASMHAKRKDEQMKTRLIVISKRGTIWWFRFRLQDIDEYTNARARSVVHVEEKQKMSRLRRRIFVRNDACCSSAFDCCCYYGSCFLSSNYHCNTQKKEEIFEQRIEKKAMPLLRGRRRERERAREKGGGEKMSFRNTRNDASKVPGWLPCIYSAWERKCVATSFLRHTAASIFRRPKRTIEIGNRYYRDHFIVVQTDKRTGDEVSTRGHLK